MPVRANELVNARRIITKVGSSILIGTDGRIRWSWLEKFLNEVAERHGAGQQIVIVSSGSIALGARKLKLAEGGRASLDDAQAAAAAGQILLCHAYSELLARRGIVAAQMLLTLEDLEDRRRYLNVSATLERLVSLGAIPIINENDSVATAEIRFGDNDRLAARLGQASNCDAVILLSDVEGLYTANPLRDPRASLITHVSDLDEARAAADSESSSGLGSGGMAAKIEAARIAGNAGIRLAITLGTEERPLERFARTGVGTIFTPKARNRARLAWLAGRQSIKGKVEIDEGARDAILRGGSLLAPGVLCVSGSFQRGDLVEIQCGSGFARALANYDSEDSKRIAGKRGAEQRALLGYEPRSTFIHRNHMVLL